MVGVNHAAVWLAGIAHFMLGAAWYTAFGEMWLDGIGKTKPASIDHRFDGENHAWLQFRQRAGLTIMQNLRFFVKFFADAMTAEFAHDGKPVFRGVALDREADVAQMRSWPYLQNSQPHAFESDIGQALGGDGRLAGVKHPAGVTVIAVFDDGDVDIDDISGSKHLVARNAVTDLMVDRGANRFWIGAIAWRAVAQRSRDRALHPGHVIVAQGIEFAGADTRLDMRFDEIEHFSCQLAGDAHFFDIFVRFEGDAHFCRLAQESAQAL